MIMKYCYEFPGEYLGLFDLRDGSRPYMNMSTAKAELTFTQVNVQNERKKKNTHG